MADHDTTGKGAPAGTPESAPFEERFEAFGADPRIVEALNEIWAGEAPALPSKVSVRAAEPPPPKNEGGFEYGWCRTDHKAGTAIRKDFRSADYMNDEPYATRVHAMLDQLGLPKPQAGEIFRGTHHDLLFLNSHGVVVRIGPTDVEDLMNPGILQPLGWLEDRDNMLDHGKPVPLTVAVYPGIELYTQFADLPAAERPPLISGLSGLLAATKQGSSDMSDNNCGIIRVVGDNGEEVAVKILLDADNSYNGSSRDLAAKRSSSLMAHAATARSTQLSSPADAPNKGEMVFNTLRDVFNAAKDVRYWARAFETHQPLRQLFWDAFRDVPAVTGLPDEAKRAAFWQKCASVTNKPQPEMLPLWRSEKTPDGGITFTRDEIPVPNLVLYRPWTGREADQAILPISQTPELVAAVARAHEEAQHLPKVEALQLRGKAGAPADKGLLGLGRKLINGFLRR